MITRIDLSGPIRIQLRLNGQHDVDPDWWRVFDESEADKELRRQSWQSYLSIPNGRIVHSIQIKDLIPIYEVGPHVSSTTNFYVRSLEVDGDDYLVTYGREHGLSETNLRIRIDRALVHETRQGQPSD